MLVAYMLNNCSIDFDENLRDYIFLEIPEIFRE